jgi:hypothetical protein
MSNHSNIIGLIKAISGQANVLTIPRIFVTLTKGNHRAALILSQCIYWSDKGNNPDGWFYKTFSEWRIETGVPRGGIETSIKAISKWVETDVRKVGNTPKNHYKINLEMLASDISDLLESNTSDLPETSISHLSENSTSSIAKTTTKTTLVREKTPRKANPTFDAIAQVSGPKDPEQHSIWVKENSGWIARAANNGAKSYAPEKIVDWFSPGGWWFTVRCKGMAEVQMLTPQTIQKYVSMAADWEKSQANPITDAERKARARSEELYGARR